MIKAGCTAFCPDGNDEKEDTDMGCFIVPAAEAVVTTIVSRAVKAKEKENAPRIVQIQTEAGCEEANVLPVSKKIGWLSKMLWGGSALLGFEHLWHGEIVPFFPFLTAASDKADLAVAIHEMATVGGSMSLLLTGVWAIMLLAASHMQKKTVIDIGTTEK